MPITNDFRHCPASSKPNRTLQFSPAERELIAAHGTQRIFGWNLDFGDFCWMVG